MIQWGARGLGSPLKLYLILQIVALLKIRKSFCALPYVTRTKGAFSGPETEILGLTETPFLLSLPSTRSTVIRSMPF